jgi:hypothetical protein
MSKLHVLDRIRKGVYRVVIHADTPQEDTNSAGKTWPDVAKGAGLATTLLTEGSLPGQISNGEKLAIEGGQKLEFSQVFEYGSIAGGPAGVLAEVDKVIARRIGRFKLVHQRFGKELG